jgi:uncharacterized C2H2 Zn-finger protein
MARSRMTRLKFVNVQPMNMAIRCPICGIAGVIKSKDDYDNWINKGRVCDQNNSTHLELL